MTTHPLQDRDAFKAARRALGLTVREVQEAMHLRDERTVRGWESGRNDIPGPAAVLLEAWQDLAHYRSMTLTSGAIVTFKSGRR